MGKKYKELCITFRSYYHDEAPLKLFRKSIPVICYWLGKHTDVYSIYPELTQSGVLHYHILLKFNSEKSVDLSCAVGQFQTKYGRCPIYDIDQDHVEIEDQSDEYKCKCRRCRIAYMRKDIDQMTKLLKVPLPVTNVSFNEYFKPMEELGDLSRRLRKQKKIIEYNIKKMFPDGNIIRP